MLCKEIPKKYTEFFEEHKVYYEKRDKFEQVILKKDGSSMYHIKYIIKDNLLIISGDMGDAIFKFTEIVNLEKLAKEYNDFGYYFMQKLSISSYKKKSFSKKVLLENLAYNSRRACKELEHSKEELKKCFDYYKRIKKTISESSSETSYELLMEDIMHEEFDKLKPIVRNYLGTVSRLNYTDYHPNFEYYYWGLKYAYENKTEEMSENTKEEIIEKESEVGGF